MSHVASNPTPSDSRYGRQISATRRDELDLLALAEVDARKGGPARPTVLDLGCGLGAMSVALAEAGAQVMAMDRSDFREEVTLRGCIAGLPEGALQFRQAIAPRDLRKAVPATPWDILYSQRMLHYLPYSDALDLIIRLRCCSSPAASLYIGVSGLYSELKTGYEAAGLPIERRFSRLAEEMGAKHQILEPVCLYTLVELVDLASAAGFVVVRAWQSDFGNVKLVAKTGLTNVGG